MLKSPVTMISCYIAAPATPTCLVATFEPTENGVTLTVTWQVVTASRHFELPYVWSPVISFKRSRCLSKCTGESTHLLTAIPDCRHNSYTGIAERFLSKRSGISYYQLLMTAGPKLMRMQVLHLQGCQDWILENMWCESL